MKIEIIGSNTINGIKLRKRVLKIANEVEDKIVINLIEDYEQVNLPILYINDKLVSRGLIPSEKEIVKYLKKKC